MNSIKSTGISQRSIAQIQRRTSCEKERPPKPVGHEIILAALIKNRTPIRLERMCGGHDVGIITQFDKYTITIRRETGQPRTYYKHDIAYFEAAEQ